MLAHPTACSQLCFHSYCTCSGLEFQEPAGKNFKRNILYNLKVRPQNGYFHVLKVHFQFLYLCHGEHTVPTQNVDFFGGPDALAALGADQLACAAGPLTAWGGSRSGADDRWQAGPPNLNFTPTLCECIFNEIITRRGVPAILSTGHTGQAVGLGYALKPAIKEKSP